MQVKVEDTIGTEFWTAVNNYLTSSAQHPDDLVETSFQQTDNLVETSAQQTDDLGQNLTSLKDVSIRSRRQLYPMSLEITTVNEKPTVQHQDNINATNEYTYLIDILYHRTTTQDKQIATNDDQDSLDILLTTTTRDNTVATNDNTFQTTQHKLHRIISLLEKN
ncbi:unnamed protein product [Mytilus coruscus]|uniref:Uncharacterized protein n=1 Tax=Mytilus coruscus TaxID=42192 RepID=A0A6J8CI34_MYTCO|nr:unnamed protein product [Mytilus coruscus]